MPSWKDSKSLKVRQKAIDNANAEFLSNFSPFLKRSPKYLAKRKKRHKKIDQLYANVDLEDKKKTILNVYQEIEAKMSNQILDKHQNKINKIPIKHSFKKELITKIKIQQDSDTKKNNGEEKTNKIGTAKKAELSNVNKDKEIKTNKTGRKAEEEDELSNDVNKDKEIKTNKTAGTKAEEKDELSNDVNKNKEIKENKTGTKAKEGDELSNIHKLNKQIYEDITDIESLIQSHSEINEFYEAENYIFGSIFHI